MTTDPGAPVVVGVDGSEQSRLAVRAAAREAAWRHRPLRVVHAFAWPLLRASVAPSPGGPVEVGLREDAERMVREATAAASQREPDLAVSGEVVTGAVSQVLLDESQRAAIMVLGSRGLGGFTGLLVGSVTVQVAEHASCPVLVVRHSEPTDGPVVVGVDGSPISEQAVGFAAEEAALRSAELVAVHAWTGPRSTGPGDMLPLVYDVDEVEAEEKRLLAESVSGVHERYPDLVVTRRVVHGRPAQTLVEEAARAQLVVVGSRGRGGFIGLTLGSVSQAVLHHAECPVAIVRPSHR
jgi:nucleotide-binding universal stress UspA family protein